MTSGEIAVVQLLEEVDFFRPFSREELWLLLDTGDWAKAEKGERIIQAGKKDLHMFLLVQGKVKIVLNEKVLAVLGAGDTFGEIGVMGEPRSANVVAQTGCLLLGFDAQRLNNLPIKLQVKLLKSILISLMVRLQRVNRYIYLNLPPLDKTSPGASS